VTTRCHGTLPPCFAMMVPTRRAELRPDLSASASAIAPYDMTRPGGMRSTSARTSSTYSSGVTRATIWDAAGVVAAAARRMVRCAMR
jgi:glutamate 5-kinase